MLLPCAPQTLFEPQVPEKARGFCFAKNAPDEKLYLRCFNVI